MESPEQMGEPPEQPEEELMKDKEEESEKLASPESYDEAGWNELQQGGAAFAIKRGKEMGVPQEELNRFAKDVIAQRIEDGDYGFVYRFRTNMGIGTEEEVRAAGEQAYKFFLESGDLYSAMSIAEDVYGKDSAEWRCASEASEMGKKAKEEKERKVTTPEEAAAMTRERRQKYGLEESSELTPEEAKEIERAIEELLKRLDEYDYDSLSLEMQNEWYWVEQEASAGEDRELAKAVLERFLNELLLTHRKT